MFRIITEVIETENEIGNDEQDKKLETEFPGEENYEHLQQENKIQVEERNESENKSESEEGEMSSEESERSLYLDEIPGKENSFYKKYGSFCITPSSDLSGYDPILRPGKSYSHKIVYKIGIYRRYMRRSKMALETEEEDEKKDEEITDIENE